MELVRCQNLLHRTFKHVLKYKAHIKYKNLQSMDVVSSFCHNFSLDIESKVVFRSINAPYSKAVILAVYFSIKRCVIRLWLKIDLPSLLFSK